VSDGMTWREVGKSEFDTLGKMSSKRVLALTLVALGPGESEGQLRWSRKAKMDAQLDGYRREGNSATMNENDSRLDFGAALPRKMSQWAVCHAI
jgi:hypothetical protein